MKGLLSHKGSSATNQRPGSRWLTTKSHDKEVAVGLTGNSSRLNLIDFEKKQEIGTMAYNECICLLTGVYYLCEIADSLIMDSLAVFSKEPWFKNGINSNFKNAQKSIRHKIKNFKYADCSDAEFYWYRGMDYFVKEYIRKDIDPDKLRSLVNGGQAFVHFFEKARKEVGNVE